MGIFLGIYDSPGGALLLDASTRARRCPITQGRRGFQALGLDIALTQAEAYRAYEWPKPLHVIKALGSQLLFEGRLEDPAIGAGGLEGTAIGYSSAVGDAPYTTLWSASGVQNWRPVTTIDSAIHRPERWQQDTDNRLYSAMQKNASYGWQIDMGGQMFLPPYGGNRNIVGLSLDYAIFLPANWTFEVLAAGEGLVGAGVIFTNVGTGVLQTGSINIVGFSNALVYYRIYNNTGGAVVFAGENGTNYVQLTNVRLVSTTANRISTTLTANRNAGTNVTATVGSTAGMYVGQRLTINSGHATLAESVIVLSIGSSTQFNATFTKNHVTTETVTALQVYADEIVKDIRAGVTSLNSGQLAASDALIQSPGVDLLNEVYEDADAPQILDRLASLGDNQTPPRRWRWFVNERRMLQFRPETDLSRTWYVDVTPDTERSLKNLFNSAYGVYEEAGGRTLRTAVSSNAASVTRHGITRRAAVKAQTTSSTQAGIHRDAYIEDHKNPTTRASIPIPQVFDAYGQWHPKYEVRPGDVLVFRLLPPTLLTTVTNISRMRIGQTTYDPITDSLTCEPDAPAASLEFLHLREEIGR